MWERPRSQGGGADSSPISRGVVGNKAVGAFSQGDIADVEAPVVSQICSYIDVE
jgi:hypothetical protein